MSIENGALKLRVYLNIWCTTKVQIIYTSSKILTNANNIYIITCTISLWRLLLFHGKLNFDNIIAVFEYIPWWIYDSTREKKENIRRKMET